MDTFMEKIVGKKKTAKDYLIMAGLIFAVPVVFLALLNIPVIGSFFASFSFAILAGLIYLAYYFIRSREIEYEYIVTNGDLDIDKIIARKRRKRILSVNSKDFDVLARYKGKYYDKYMDNIQNRIEAVSSMDDKDIYFFIFNQKGEQTIVFFQPEERMLKNFKKFNPRNVYIEDINIQ